MFKNMQIYRLPAGYDASGIAQPVFQPCTGLVAKSIGFVPPRPDYEELVASVDGQLFFRMCTEKRVIPGELVTRMTREKCALLAEMQGFAPGKKATREVKEQVIDELTPTAPTQRVYTDCWLDPAYGFLVIDTATPARADDVIKLLLKHIDRFPLESLRVQRSPSAAMTGWLESDEMPHGFTCDQAATLEARGESHAVVQYKKHTLDPVEVSRHIQLGKLCTRLAMTYSDRISFTLDESLTVRAIKPLDILTQDRDTSGGRYDGDRLLMAGEYRSLIVALIYALGGEAVS